MKFIFLPTIVLAALSWAFFAYIVYFIPPQISGNLVVSNLIYFLLAGFLALGFTSSLIFYLLESTVRQKTKTLDPTNLLTKLYIKSARRGFLFSFLVVGLTLLKLTDFLNILNGALLIGAVVLIEVYFSSR